MIVILTCNDKTATPVGLSSGKFFYRLTNGTLLGVFAHYRELKTPEEAFEFFADCAESNVSVVPPSESDWLDTDLRPITHVSVYFD